ncbi:hypothetical protein KY285_017855 [Solanum tuberosum]|nr:hypothetical protein KY285_017855 [Solanum tuberosum]
MASTSKKWARDLYFVSSRLYFLLILFQLPLFRFPCRIGTCTTPIEVSLSLLYANGVVPGGMVKALIYPGAVAKAIYKNNAIPSYGKLLEAYKFTNMKESYITHDLQNLEVIVGSYLSVAGALLGLMKSGRLSLIGILLITWGLDKQDKTREVQEFCISSLNCSTCTLARMNSHHSHNRTRKSSAFATPPSSIISQTEESRNLANSMENSPLDAASKRPDSSVLLTHKNAIGIIGGLSIGTTLNFVSKLVTWSSKNGGNDIPFVLCSDPVLNKELSFHERGSSSYLTGKNKNLLKDHAPVVENLRHKRIFLEKSGARCIVMPCYISHSWHDEVALGSSVPVLHMGECVAKELKDANLRPLEAGSTLRIGVLASDATLSAGFYQEKLQNEGFEVVLPDKATMEHTVIPSLEALNRKDIEGAQNLFRIALQVLVVRAVNTIIIASDDMRDLLPPDDPLLKKCVDPMDALARSTVKFLQSVEGNA